VAVPVLTAVASPELLTVATTVLLDVQLQMLVIPTPSVPSARVADAVNWTCPPALIVCEPGLTAMLWMCTVATVMAAVLEFTLPDLALIVEVDNLVPEGRLEAAVAKPALLMVAVLVLDEDQVTCVVTSPVELLPKVPSALNCAVPPVRT